VIGTLCPFKTSSSRIRLSVRTRTPTSCSTTCGLALGFTATALRTTTRSLLMRGVKKAKKEKTEVLGATTCTRMPPWSRPNSASTEYVECAHPQSWHSQLWRGPPRWIFQLPKAESSVQKERYPAILGLNLHMCTASTRKLFPQTSAPLRI